MSDLSWAALIGAGSAVLSSVLTNFFNARATARQLAHSARQSQVQWQRSEATRKAEEAREDTLRQAALQASHLRRFWGHVLEARLQVDGVFVFWGGGTTLMQKYPVDPMPMTCALQAYAVALLDVPAVFPAAQTWFDAVAAVQREMRPGRYEQAVAALPDEKKAFWSLLKVVARLSGAVLDVGEGMPDSAVTAAPAKTG